MKILIMNLAGGLIPIPINDNETFREFNKRMEKEHGMRMNFENLQLDKQMDLDQNIFTYLSENNQQATIGSDNSLQKSTDENRNLNIQLRKEGAEEFLDKMQIRPATQSSNSLSCEEVIKEGDHYLVKKDPELLEEFHAVLERIKCEESTIAEEFETVDVKPAVLCDNYQVQRSEQSLELSKVLLELNNGKSALCRLCATQSNDSVYMFDPNQLYKNILEKIEHCLPIVVRETDTLPKQACRSCLEKLEVCHQFYKTVAEAERQLTILGEKISEDFWKTEKYYQTSSLSNERGLKISSDEDSNNNQSRTVSEKLQIANSITETNSSLSNLMFCSRESTSRELNNTNLSTEDKGAASYIDTEEFGRTSRALVEEYSFYSIPNSPTLVPHLKEESRPNETVTSKLYSPSITMNDELSNVRTKSEKDKAGYSLARKMISCRVCGQIFRTATRCHLHSSIHALENYYPCSLCDKTFTTFRDWNEHRHNHIEIKKFERRAATYACDECDKKFVTEARLQFHKFNHSSDVKSSHCKKCDKVMDSQAALYQHIMTIHPQDKEHCCDICGKQFRSQSQLNGHQGKHTAKRNKENFSCAYCEKSFAQKWNLIIHIRSHTGERPFSCDFCDKSYKTQAQKNSHRRTHTGEKPFKCTTCGKTFAQALRLSEHANVHTVTRPYKCSLCDKSFKRIHARTIHMTTHTGEKPYQCGICGKNFRWPTAIRRHKKDQHGIK